jgi:hypothetical protein
MNPTPLDANTIVCEPESAFASWIAARSVHVNVDVRHEPFPGFESGWSPGEFTVNVAACASGVLRCINATPEASSTRTIVLVRNVILITRGPFRIDADIAPFPRPGVPRC